MKQHSIKSFASVVMLGAVAAAAPLGQVYAQPVASAAAVTQAPFPPPISAAKVLPQGELERRIADQGVYVTKMEIRDLLLKVKAYDNYQRRVSLTFDRRTGDLLAREYNVDKKGH